MARESADKLAASPKPKGRPAIWATIRDQRTFTRRSIQQATDVQKKTITDYLDGLEAAGIIQRIATEPAVQWSLVRDSGIEPPRVRKDGTPVTQGSGTERMWRAMKMLRAFDARELALSASLPCAVVSIETARDYCGHLYRAGYLAVTRASSPGRAARYRMARDTGPKPPMIQRVKVVWDQNLHRVMSREDRS